VGASLANNHIIYTFCDPDKMMVLKCHVYFLWSHMPPLVKSVSTTCFNFIFYLTNDGLSRDINYKQCLNWRKRANRICNKIRSRPIKHWNCPDFKHRIVDTVKINITREKILRLSTIKSCVWIIVHTTS